MIITINTEWWCNIAVVVRACSVLGGACSSSRASAGYASVALSGHKLSEPTARKRRKNEFFEEAKSLWPNIAFILEECGGEAAAAPTATTRALVTTARARPEGLIDRLES